MAQFHQGMSAIRALVAKNNAPANFPADLAYDYQAGCPSAVAGGKYVSQVQASPVGAASWPGRPNEPNPFGSLR